MFENELWPITLFLSILVVPIIGGCGGTLYGCCDDGYTYATGPNKEGCENGKQNQMMIGWKSKQD